MKKCIMLGNGINRCMTTKISWNDLLDKVAKENDIILNSNISFPMQFENLANQILKKRSHPSDEVYSEIKNNIISQVKSAVLSFNSTHRLLSENADSIITTNYDFLIESSLDSAFNIESIPLTSKDSNNKYNINNFTTINDKVIYHIHGDLRKEASICLGYEHYAGTLQHLRSSIVTKKEKDGVKLPAIIWKLKNPSYELETWAVKFFTEDIHIVGFGLTQSEIDIWWLLTYRASLIYANRFEGRTLIKNKIVFHDVSVEENTDMKYALKNNAVNYQFHKINTHDNADYAAAYKRIATEIFT